MELLALYTCWYCVSELVLQL